MRLATKEIFSFDELSDSAKEKARDWYRQGNLDHEWWDSVYDDFAQICGILGVELSTTKNGLAVYFSGFSHQGQGSCFDAQYRYAKGAAKKIRAYAPQDKELWRIADALQDAQKLVFYSYSASIESHSRSMLNRVEVEKIDSPYADLNDSAVSTITEALNDLNHWLFNALSREYDYLMSDESVDDLIVANGYEFTEDGQFYR